MFRMSVNQQWWSLSLCPDEICAPMLQRCLWRNGGGSSRLHQTLNVVGTSLRSVDTETLQPALLCVQNILSDLTCLHACFSTFWVQHRVYLCLSLTTPWHFLWQRSTPDHIEVAWCLSVSVNVNKPEIIPYSQVLNGCDTKNEITYQKRLLHH